MLEDRHNPSGVLAETFVPDQIVALQSVGLMHEHMQDFAIRIRCVGFENFDMVFREWGGGSPDFFVAYRLRVVIRTLIFVSCHDNATGEPLTAG